MKIRKKTYFNIYIYIYINNNNNNNKYIYNKTEILLTISSFI